jgi:hypothetical protein
MGASRLSEAQIIGMLRDRKTRAKEQSPEMLAPHARFPLRGKQPLRICRWSNVVMVIRPVHFNPGFPFSQ